MVVSPPEAVRHRRATIHPLRVAAVERLTDDSVAIEFEVPGELAGEYQFVQGQHVSLRSPAAGDDVRRSYSICSAAGSGRLRVAVKRLPAGAFSAYAHETLQPGDVVEVVTPVGRFNTPLVATQANHYVAIAAGSGITPILSIIATTLRDEPRSRVTLLFGNRTVRDIMFLEELEDLKNVHPGRFVMYHVLSREEQEVPLFNGRLDGPRIAEFLDLLVPPDGVAEWFLCGPRGMIDGARDVLGARGVDPQRIHFELFHSEPAAALAPPADGERDTAGASANAEVTVVLDGRRSTLSVPHAGERLLDAVLRVRSDAPYACKGGVCGTCRAKLVEGTVSMEQNYALEQAELDAGFVLACQSHPTSERVVLDFDA